jgi:hypothetical protein
VRAPRPAAPTAAGGDSATARRSGGRLLETGTAEQVFEAAEKRETRVYVHQSRESEEATRGRNLRAAFTTGDLVLG